MSIIKPRTAFNAAAAAEPVDYRPTQEILDHGRAGGQIAVFDKAVSFGGNYLLAVIKTPGTDAHRAPPGFEDVIQKAADHQFSVSPHAKDKLGLMIARRQNIGADAEELFAAKWHAHNAFSVFGRTMLALFSLVKLRDANACKAFLQASSKLSVNEYIYTDREPTLVQAAKTGFSLSARFLKVGIIPEKGDDIPYFRPQENALTFMPGIVYHRPPLLAEIKEENRGEERLFVDIMYLPTRAMERKIP